MGSCLADYCGISLLWESQRLRTQTAKKRKYTYTYTDIHTEIAGRRERDGTAKGKKKHDSAVYSAGEQRVRTGQTRDELGTHNHLYSVEMSEWTTFGQ